MGSTEIKISLLADDVALFIDVNDKKVFECVFKTLNNFAKISGCKANMDKCQAFYIGAAIGDEIKPLQEVKIMQRNNKTMHFKFISVMIFIVCYSISFPMPNFFFFT